MRSLRIIGTTLLCALALAAPAWGKTKVLWHQSATYNSIAADISGVADMDATFEDDWNEWALITGTNCSGGPCVLGFTVPSAVPGEAWTCTGSGCYGYTSAPTTCPPLPGICIAVYHRIYFSPDTTQAFFGMLPIDAAATWQAIWTRLQAGAEDTQQAARAILTFIHENYHNRLMSGDEGLVNACALRDFGFWLARDFQIPETVTTTVTVPQDQTQTKQVAYYVRVRVAHHKRLKNGHVKRWFTYKKELRHKTVTTTVTVQVQQQQTVPNPLYVTLVADAQAFYQSQPAPYNAGTCTAAPIG